VILPSNPVLLDELAEKGWLSLNKFAQLISVTYPTAMKMVKRGNVIVIPVGGVNRVMQDEVLRYLKHGNTRPEADAPVEPAIRAPAQPATLSQPTKQIQPIYDDSDDDF
jgi:hypothetical protein